MLLFERRSQINFNLFVRFINMVIAYRNNMRPSSFYLWSYGLHITTYVTCGEHGVGVCVCVWGGFLEAIQISQLFHLFTQEFVFTKEEVFPPESQNFPYQNFLRANL